MNKNQKLINQIIELWKQGHSDEYISIQLSKSLRGDDIEERVAKLLADAGTQLGLEYDDKKGNIIMLHRVRYTGEINRLLATEELPESEIGKSITYEEWAASRQNKIKAYSEALDCITQLENILQLHNKTIVEVDENLTVDVNENKPQHDLSKLSLEEKIELLHLIQKAKVSSEIKPISECVTDVPVTKDVEEVVLEPVNVDQIQQEPLPEKQQVLNTTDPATMLRQALRLLAAKEFEKAGANLDDEEKLCLD